MSLCECLCVCIYVHAIICVCKDVCVWGANTCVCIYVYMIVQHPSHDKHICALLLIISNIEQSIILVFHYSHNHVLVCLQWLLSNCATSIS